jgi:hypothetical protein
MTKEMIEEVIPWIVLAAMPYFAKALAWRTAN